MSAYTPERAQRALFFATLLAACRGAQEPPDRALFAALEAGLDTPFDSLDEKFATLRGYAAEDPNLHYGAWLLYVSLCCPQSWQGMTWVGPDMGGVGQDAAPGGDGGEVHLRHMGPLTVEAEPLAAELTLISGVLAEDFGAMASARGDTVTFILRCPAKPAIDPPC